MGTGNPMDFLHRGSRLADPDAAPKQPEEAPKWPGTSPGRIKNAEAAANSLFNTSQRLQNSSKISLAAQETMTAAENAQCLHPPLLYNSCALLRW